MTRANKGTPEKIYVVSADKSQIKFHNLGLAAFTRREAPASRFVCRARLRMQFRCNEQRWGKHGRKRLGRKRVYKWPNFGQRSGNDLFPPRIARANASRDHAEISSLSTLEMCVCHAFQRRRSRLNGKRFIIENVLILLHIYAKRTTKIRRPMRRPSPISRGWTLNASGSS